MTAGTDAVTPAPGRSSQTRSPGRTFALPALPTRTPLTHRRHAPSTPSIEVIDRLPSRVSVTRSSTSSSDVEPFTPTGGAETTGCAPKSFVIATETDPLPPPTASPHPMSRTAAHESATSGRRGRTNTGTRSSVPQ